MVVNENEEKILRFREANESTLDILNINRDLDSLESPIYPEELERNDLYELFYLQAR